MRLEKYVAAQADIECFILSDKIYIIHNDMVFDLL